MVGDQPHRTDLDLLVVLLRHYANYLPSKEGVHQTRGRSIFLDATYCKVRIGAHVVSHALVVATGVSNEGTREVLGTASAKVSPSISGVSSWLGCGRRPLGVHLVISDAHAGLKAAVAQQFTGASWQRCQVHFMRNVGSAVASKHVPAAIKTIFAQTDPDALGVQWDRVGDTLAESFPKVASMMRDAKADVLAFRVFPKAHWQKIWANNPIERINKEINAALMSWRSSPT